jgi:hypothetical protein
MLEGKYGVEWKSLTNEQMQRTKSA